MTMSSQQTELEKTLESMTNEQVKAMNDAAWADLKATTDISIRKAKSEIIQACRKKLGQQPYPFTFKDEKSEGGSKGGFKPFSSSNYKKPEDCAARAKLFHSEVMPLITTKAKEMGGGGEAFNAISSLYLSAFIGEIAKFERS